MLFRDWRCRLAGKVVIRSVVNAVEFRPSHGEKILNVARAFCVVGKFFVILIAQAFGREAEGEKEIPRRFFIVFVIFEVGSFLAEPLMFHLFELDRPENKVAGCNFVSERFTYLTYSERNFGAGGALNVKEVDVFALSKDSFRKAKIPTA